MHLAHHLSRPTTNKETHTVHLGLQRLGLLEHPVLRHPRAQLVERGLRLIAGQHKAFGKRSEAFDKLHVALVLEALGGKLELLGPLVAVPVKVVVGAEFERKA